MKNQKADIKEIEAAVEFAGCYNAPAAAARDAAKVIDDVFLVIHRDELPDVDTKLGGWGNFAVDGEIFSENTAPQILIDHAYQYLAAAGYVQTVQEHREAKKAADEKFLNETRYLIYVELFEDNALAPSDFHWEGLRKSTKNSVTTILDLRRKLASFK